MAPDRGSGSDPKPNTSSNRTVRLVFHEPSGVKERVSTAFADAMGQVLDADTEGEVLIVGPYLSARILKRLVQGRSFRLITDIDACFEAGARAPLADFLEIHLSRVRHVAEVHAKVIATRNALLVGSANFTDAGIASRDEVGCLVQEPSAVGIIRAWFDRLWARGKVVTLDQLSQARDRPSHPRQLCGVEVDRFRTRSNRPSRSLGWLASGKDQGSSDTQAGNTAFGTGHDNAVAERQALIAELQALIRNRREAATVLDLLAQALEASGLSLEHPSLHLNFGGNRVSVTIGQRFVAYCTRKGDATTFGFILDSEEIAKQAEAKLPGSRVSHFRDRGTQDLPMLHVPLRELPNVDDGVYKSWKRAIRAEAARRNRDGSVPTSSYRKKHLKPYLYHVLRDETLRHEVLHQAYRMCWWFGVDNGSRGHVKLEEIRPFLSGEQKVFQWPVGNSRPKDLYRHMLPGDPVLVWTGHGRDEAWGILGHAKLARVEDEKVVLGEMVRFPSPITPYPKRKSREKALETREVRFLREAFGRDFIPLGDVMRAVYGTQRRTLTPVAEVRWAAFEAVLKFVEKRGA